MDSSTVRIVCAVLAILFLGIIVLRRKKKPPFKSASFKTSEEMVTYIKEKRRAKGLPTYED